MSGETARQESGWTVDTLKHHFDDLRTDDQRALNAALASAEKANDKSESAQNTVNKTQNEFRATLKDQAATLMPIKEAEAKFDNLQKQITDLSNNKEKAAGRSDGFDKSWAIIITIVGVGLVIIGLILR